MNEKINESINEWINESTNQLINVLMSEWVKDWMSEWVNGWMDGWMDFWLSTTKTTSTSTTNIGVHIYANPDSCNTGKDKRRSRHSTIRQYTISKRTHNRQMVTITITHIIVLMLSSNIVMDHVMIILRITRVTLIRMMSGTTRCWDYASIH